jgi:hypothetical protein
MDQLAWNCCFAGSHNECISKTALQYLDTGILTGWLETTGQNHGAEGLA